MRTTTKRAALALLLGAAACGKTKTDQARPFADVLPDVSAVVMETDPNVSAALAAPAPDLALVAPDPRLLSTVMDDLQAVKARAEELNAGLRHVFARVEELTATGGAELPNGTKVWGPAVRCVEPGPSSTCLAQASVRLVVRLVGDHAGGFAFEARGVSSVSEADFRPVLAGWMVKGEEPRRGRGRLWVSFEHLRAAAGAWDGASGFKGQGFLAAGFAAGPFAKAARYRLLGFTRDATLHAPVTAGFAGWRGPNGVLRARAAGLGNLDTSGPALEAGAWRAVYVPNLRARAFSVISNWTDSDLVTHGDVPSGDYWFGRTCYAANGTTPEYKEWFLCPASGGPLACVASGGLATLGNPSPSPGHGEKVAGAVATWQDSSCFSVLEPDAAKPPAGVPGGPNDDGAEDAEGPGSGLAPPAAPGDPTSPDQNPVM